MVLGLVGIVLAVGLAVVCVKLAGANRSLRRDLDAALRDASTAAHRTYAAQAERGDAQRQRDELARTTVTLAAERDRLVVELDELQRTHDQLSGDHTRLTANRDDITADHTAATAELARERSRADDAEHARAAADDRAAELLTLIEGGGRHQDPRAQGVPDGQADAAGSGGGAWRIVLAILERRWVGVVGAPPDARGVVSGPVSDQLAEALARESERLREEVGVDVEVSSASPVEPADPATFLLAAIDLLGVLASACERVVLTLDGTLAVSGEGWAGPPHELDLARARALAAGTSVDAITVDGETVTFALRPAPAALSADSTG